MCLHTAHVRAAREPMTIPEGVRLVSVAWMAVPKSVSRHLQSDANILRGRLSTRTPSLAIRSRVSRP